MSFKQHEYQRLPFVPVYVLKRVTSMVDEPLQEVVLWLIRLLYGVSPKDMGRFGFETSQLSKGHGFSGTAGISWYCVFFLRGLS